MKTNDKHIDYESRSEYDHSVAGKALKAFTHLERTQKCNCPKLSLTIADVNGAGFARTSMFETDAASLELYTSILFDITDIFEDLTFLSKEKRLARMKRLKAATSANYVGPTG